MSSALHHACELANRLHAVFTAQGGPAFAQAFTAVCADQERHCHPATAVHAAHAATTPARPAINTDAAEFAFNRLFVGPDKVPAPPYASVYLDSDPQLMGTATMEIRELMHTLGLAVTHSGQPDDYLACELELWLVLARLLQTAPQEHAPAVRHALYWLTEEHMGRWIPVFLQRARKAEASALLDALLNTLEQWLELSLQRSLYE